MLATGVGSSTDGVVRALLVGPITSVSTAPVAGLPERRRASAAPR
jgi:hypothetical protein